MIGLKKVECVLIARMAISINQTFFDKIPPHATKVINTSQNLIIRINWTLFTLSANFPAYDAKRKNGKINSSVEILTATLELNEPSVIPLNAIITKIAFLSKLSFITLRNWILNKPENFL